MIKNLPILKPFTTLIICISLANTSYAKSEKNISDCDKLTVNNIEYSQCLDRVKTSVENELQLWINNQIFILEELGERTGRTSILEIFKRSQDNFITYRENNCRWQFLAISPGTGAGPAYKKCFITLSQQRIAELSQYERN